MRWLFDKHLKAKGWLVFTSDLQKFSDSEIETLPSFVALAWQPLSTTSTTKPKKKKLKRLIKKIAGLFLWPDIGIFWSIQNFNHVNQIIKKSKTRVVLCAVCYPFSSLLMGALLKKWNPQKVEFIAHYIDSFYLINKGNDTSSFYAPLNYLAERFVNSQADKIIINKQKKDHFSKIFPEFVSKCDFVEELPTSVPRVSPAVTPSAKRRYFFAGTLYKNLRNPLPALQVLSALPDAEIIFAGNTNDCDDIIHECATRFSNFRHIGMLSFDDLQKQYNESDFLINIDNADPNQQSPGKIFEYMLLDKPILNFYESQSICSPILKEKSLLPDAFLDIPTAQMDARKIKDISKKIANIDLSPIRRFQIEEGYGIIAKLYGSHDPVTGKTL